MSTSTTTSASASAPTTTITQPAEYKQQDIESLEKWNQIKIHNQYDRQSELNKYRQSNNQSFNSDWGPAFVSSANLHMGHTLVESTKSTVLNYKQMCGFNCSNQLGLDTHGLPIECKANERLGIKTTYEVEKLGIDIYNAECKKMINEFSGSWADIYARMGRWVDHSTTYKTMDCNYMESVWWVFKQLWDKGLVYQGSKVMPFSTKCETAISKSESTENYKMVSDKSIYVKFKIIPNNENTQNTYFLVWTTTPWTLPGNLALCLNPTDTYVLVGLISENQEKEPLYILAESCVENVWPTKKSQKPIYTILKTFIGSELANIEYEPLYKVYGGRKWLTVVDNYVEASEIDEEIEQTEHNQKQNKKQSKGTGIVHIAPFFGQEDWNVCLKNNIVTTSEVYTMCPVDSTGCYTSFVPKYAKKYIFDCNQLIIDELKQDCKLVKIQTIDHKYPFCPRTDTPLIYKAVPGLFIKVSALKERMLKNDEKVEWITTITQNLYRKWVENAEDWNISRSRIFGTPIPVWVSEDGKEMKCFGSIAELVEAAKLDKPLVDLHPEFVNNIKILSSEGRGYLKRVPEIFDCWFESGCVPLGRIHYPFENKTAFDNQEYLSDFVCEGREQFKLWFYNMSILSTALFDKPAFKTVLATGMILAEDGKKMAKRKGNFKDPRDLIKSYGADAVRLYLLRSPALIGEPLRLKEQDILIIKNHTNLLTNACAFLSDHYGRLKENGKKITLELKSDHVMDQWIKSRTHTLISKIHTNMKNYKLAKCANAITEHFDVLANSYIKLNRDRMKGKMGIEEWTKSLSTLYQVLTTFIVICAPFMPFLSEYLYGKLNMIERWHESPSVHLLGYPQNNEYMEYNPELEDRFYKFERVVNLIRNIRGSNSIQFKRPVSTAVICHDDPKFITDIKLCEEYLIGESNLITVKYDVLKKYVTYELKPNNFKLKELLVSLDRLKEIKKFMDAISDIANDNEKLQNFMKHGKIMVYDIELGYDEIELYVKQVDISEYTKESNTYKLQTDLDLMVLLDTDMTAEVKSKYSLKLICTRIQRMRKEAGLKPVDKINIWYLTEHKQVSSLMNENTEYLTNYLFSLPKSFCRTDELPNILSKDKIELLDDEIIEIVICKA